MKRCLVIAFIVAMCISNSYAQIDFHLFAGLNSTALKAQFGDGVSDVEKDEFNAYYQSSILPFVGIKGKYRFDNRFSLSVESQISFKGQKRDEIDYKERSLYIDLIPTLEIKLVEGLNFGIGWYAGVRAHSYFSEVFTVSLGEFYREDWDYGGTVSLAYEVGRFTFRAAYFHGLNDINTNITLLGLLDKRYRVYQLGVGYRISKTETIEI